MNYKIRLYYDKECPFCTNYAKFLKLKQNHDLAIVNARDSKKELNEFRNLGFDINDGFIIKVDDKKIYQGADAVKFLDEISIDSKFLYRTKFFKIFLYPIIKLFRKVILCILGKDSNIKY